MNETINPAPESAGVGDEMAVDAVGTVGVTSPADFCAPWALHGEMFDSVVARLHGADLTAGPAIDEALDDEAPSAIVTRTADGIAVVSIYGVLMKGRGWFTGTSTTELRREIRRLGNDSRAMAIILKLDSPGGTVAGTDALASDIATVAGKKLVVAHIDDLGASAAYYVASQASRVTVQPAGLVGGIGVYSVLKDSSKGASDAGITVHVIKPSKGGDFKGMGVPGTTITDEQLAEAQRLVTGFHNAFVAAVAKGRKLPVGYISTIADGRVHPAAEAVKLKLADAVETFDQTLAWVRTQIGSTPTSGSAKPVKATVTDPEPVAEAPAPPKAATFSELKAAIPKASDEFLLGCVDEGDTIDAAKDRYCEHLERVRDESVAETARANPTAKRSGVPVILDRGGPTEAACGAKEVFEEIVQERMSETQEPRHRAWAWACRNHRDLREAMVAEANADRMM